MCQKAILQPVLLSFLGQRCFLLGQTVIASGNIRQPNTSAINSSAPMTCNHISQEICWGNLKKRAYPDEWVKFLACLSGSATDLQCTEIHEEKLPYNSILNGKFVLSTGIHFDSMQIEVGLIGFY